MISSSEQTFLGLHSPVTPLPHGCVHELVQSIALQRPDAIAIGFGDRLLTYAELDLQSTRLTASLRERGVSTGTLVGLLVDRSPRMVVALLAILKAGGAYVPLDPSYPLPRISSMLSISGAPLLISETAVLSRLKLQIDTQILLLDTSDNWEAREGEQPNDPAVVPATHRVNLEDTAYVIFTSGSTGQPKGVEISHGALVNLFWSLKDQPGMTASDTILAVTNISFDMASPELLLPLVVGARIEMATYEEAADPERMLAKLEASQATILQATPVTWRLLIGAGWKGNPGLTAWCGGEELPRSLAAELLPRASALWNLYGPTETTVWSAASRITSAEGFIPLGTPVANTSLYVLDEERHPVASGVPGELYIGGSGLAKGYWARPDLTEQGFPMVTLGDGHAERLYRTGDRVRPHADGSLEFLGRADRQVKLRGFRIELGEVEQAASTCAGVQDVAVTKVEDKERGDFLAAYVVPEPGRSVDAAVFRRHISQTLPGYMVPATVRLLDRLPVTPNGKIDRKQLPAPTEQERAFADADLAPHLDVETRLTRLWCEALRVPSIGRDDNFFELGGDSLLAAQLVSRTAKTFGRPCNVASLLQSPTIASYAGFLTGDSLPNYIVLHEGSVQKRNQTIFWMDNPGKLHHLADLLEDQPFYSMLLSADDIATVAPEYPLERLGASMVKQILDIQSEGQFYIGGFCQSALLAYEVGQQLRSAGYDVPLLIMVDPEDATISRNERPLLETAFRRVKRERFHLSNMFKRPASDWIAYLQRRYEGVRFVLDERKWQRTALAGETAPHPARELAQALFVSRLNYVPQPYAGRVLFIEADFRPERDEQAAMAEWNSLVPNAVWRRLLGEHLGLFSFPVVRTLSAEVRTALDETLT